MAGNDDRRIERVDLLERRVPLVSKISTPASDVMTTELPSRPTGPYGVV
ncbi:MAG: hypothetical protein ACM4AI_21925 [Acidobacteriota bacterium]